MRDVLVGGGGLIVGGVAGALGLLGLEVVLAGVVAGTLVLSAPVPPAPVTAPSASSARSAAPSEVLVSGVPAAEPGEVQVLTMAAVQVVVDGAPVSFDSQQGFVTSVSPGRHRLQVLDAFGRITADTEVEVTSGRRSQWRFAKGTLSDLGGMPRPGSAAPAPAAVATVSTVGTVLPVVLPAPPDVLVDVALPVVREEGDRTLSLSTEGRSLKIELPRIGLGKR